jgi:hypothetical protein
VPIAGNYFDETLARIIHELLSDEAVLGTGKLQYRYPLVAHEKQSDEHAKASRAFWTNIRRAKQQWAEGKDFEVVVGELYGKGEETDLISYDPDGEGLPVPFEVSGWPGVVLRNFPDGQKFVLVIPPTQVLSHPRVVRLVEFVTREVIREALGVAGLRSAEIETLIVSGRGALWPGLRQRLEQELPKARVAAFATSEMMKAAVARGAIARHDFVRESLMEADDQLRGRLAVVYGHEAGTHAVFEDQWDRPITIPVAKFRIVAVGLSAPDPARDLGNGLRKHFYVGVGRHEYATRQFGGNILRFQRVGAGEIVITNQEGEQYPIGRHTVRHAYAMWPIGHPLLSPDEEQA